MRISMRAVGLSVVFSGILLMPTANRLSGAEKPATAKTQTLVNVEEANEKTLLELRKLVTDLDFFEQPLPDCLEEISQRRGIKFIIDTAALDMEQLPDLSQLTVTMNLSGVSLGTALDFLLRQHELDYTIREGMLVVSTPVELEAQLLMRVYPVRNMQRTDQRSNSLHELAEVIKAHVDPESWSHRDGSCVITPYHGALVISQTLRNHLQIKQLLGDLQLAHVEGREPNSSVPVPSRRGRRLGGGVGGDLGGLFSVADEKGDDPFSDAADEAEGPGDDNPFDFGGSEQDEADPFDVDGNPFDDVGEAEDGEIPFDFQDEADSRVEAEVLSKERPQEPRAFVSLEAGETPMPIDLEQIISVDFRGTPLQEVADAIGKACGFAVILDHQAMDAVGLDATGQTITFKLKRASVENVLQLILRELELAHTIDNDVLLITTPGEAEGRLNTRLQNVRDLLNPDQPSESMNGLIEMIETTVDSDSWEELGGMGTIAAYQGIFAISTTHEVHNHVDELLASLRETLETAGGPTIAIPPRAPRQLGKFSN